MTTKEEAIKIFQDKIKTMEDGAICCNYGNDKDAFIFAIQAIQAFQTPCDDCVSRQKVNILVDELARAISDERCCMPRGRSTGAIMQDILDLPPVNPQKPKTGRWIKYGVPRCGEQHYQCTSCGYYINFGQWGELYTKEFKYCPNCMAKMTEGVKDNG